MQKKKNNRIHKWVCTNFNSWIKLTHKPVVWGNQVHICNKWIKRKLDFHREMKYTHQSPTTNQLGKFWTVWHLANREPEHTKYPRIRNTRSRVMYQPKAETKEGACYRQYHTLSICYHWSLQVVSAAPGCNPECIWFQGTRCSLGALLVESMTFLLLCLGV